MKQTAVDFIVKELDILHRERKEKVIDAETFFKHKGVLIQLAKEKEKEQSERMYSEEEVSKEVARVSFNLGYDKGAEWQAQRMYSEEEVLEILFELSCNNDTDKEEVEEWFEQFKKK